MLNTRYRELLEWDKNDLAEYILDLEQEIKELSDECLTIRIKGNLLIINNMRNWTEFHTANKESVARWMFDCGYEDLKEPGKMKVDDLIACDWLTLKGYMPYEEHPYKMTGQ